MTIVVAATSSVTQGASVTAVTSSPSIDTTGGSNRLLVSCTSVWAANDAASNPMADVAANSWTKSSGTFGNFGGSSGELSIWYAKGASGNASETATFTGDTAARWYTILLLEATGIDATAPNDVAANFTTSFSSNTCNGALITPAAGDHLLVVVAANDTAAVDGSVANAGTGAATWTTLQNSGWPVDLLVAYTIVTADGVKTYGVTYTNNAGTGASSGVGIAAFKAAAAAGLPPGLGPVVGMPEWAFLDTALTR